MFVNLKTKCISDKNETFHKYLFRLWLIHSVIMAIVVDIKMAFKK